METNAQWGLLWLGSVTPTRAGRHSSRCTARRAAGSARVVVYRRKPLITNDGHSTTSCTPPPTPLRALPVISWPGLIKQRRLLQPAAEQMRWAADKPADGCQPASTVRGTVDEFLTHSVIVQEAQTSSAAQA